MTITSSVSARRSASTDANWLMPPRYGRTGPTIAMRTVRRPYPVAVTTVCSHPSHNATLRTRDEVDQATRALRALGLLSHPRVREKNWDLHLAVRFLLDHVPRTARILDAGGAISPVMWHLERLRYRDLWACDLR